MQKVCKGCGKLLDVSYFTKSKKFKDGYNNKCRKCNSIERKKYVRTCVVCGKEFKTSKKNAQYCSRICIGRSKHNKIKHKCDGCGKEIKVFPSKLKSQEHVFCSKECYRKNIQKFIEKKSNVKSKSEKNKYLLHAEIINGKTYLKKVCKNCKKLLDIECFSKNSILKDGYESKCKGCMEEHRKKYIKTCLICGKQFKTANKETKYCSYTCIGNARRNRIKYKCDGCGKEIEVFPYVSKKQKYIFCSNECYKKNIGKFFCGVNSPNYSREKCVCDNCGKEFFRRKKLIENNQYNYCSRECQAQHYSKRFIGENSPHWNPDKLKTNCAYCGKEIVILKCKVKNVKRTYCSEECLRKGQSKYYSKENHPRWNPDITNMKRIINRHFLEYNKWRKKVYNRDKYTCQCCGNHKSGTLVAHHILNYSEHKELSLAIGNGITLCKKCHKKFHDTYGYKHNNKEQLEEFFENYKQPQNVKSKA